MKILQKLLGFAVYILLLCTSAYVDVTAQLDIIGHLCFTVITAFIVVCGFAIYNNGDASSDPEIVNQVE